jgi:hypothetical protein
MPNGAFFLEAQVVLKRGPVMRRLNHRYFET